MSDPFSQWVSSQNDRYREEHQRWIEGNPNLLWRDYLDQMGSWRAMSPSERGPRTRPRWYGSLGAWAEGRHDRECAACAAGSRYCRDGGHTCPECTGGAPKMGSTPSENMGMLLTSIARQVAQEKDKQLTEVTAERDMYKAVAHGPELERMIEAGEQDGPHAALAEARAILVEAYKLREHAIQKAAAADEAREAAEKWKAAAEASQAKSIERGKDYQAWMDNAVQRSDQYDRAIRDLKGHAKDIDMAWTALVIWLVICSVLAGIAAWPVVEGWFW